MFIGGFNFCWVKCVVFINQPGFRSYWSCSTGRQSICFYSVCWWWFYVRFGGLHGILICLHPSCSRFCIRVDWLNTRQWCFMVLVPSSWGVRSLFNTFFCYPKKHSSAGYDVFGPSVAAGGFRGGRPEVFFCDVTSDGQREISPGFSKAPRGRTCFEKQLWNKVSRFDFRCSIWYYWYKKWKIAIWHIPIIPIIPWEVWFERIFILVFI